MGGKADGGRSREMFGQGKVFEMFAESLRGEEEAAREALILRLRWFGEDVDVAIARLKEDPGAGVSLIVDALSDAMQVLDREAGRVEALRGTLAQAREWALLLPDADDVHT